MDKLHQIWSKSNKDTIITKFEQDVLESLRRLPLKYKSNINDHDTGLEVDMIISEYKGKQVKIAVEVNGVFHYSRNSEETLGKDKIKQAILKKLGYQVLVIPYYQWCILEEKQKSQFLKDVIEHCILPNN